MGLPIIPFVVGAAVGAASTYLAKNKATRDRLVSRFKEIIPGGTSGKEAADEFEETVVSVEPVEEDAPTTSTEADASETDSDNSSAN